MNSASSNLGSLSTHVFETRTATGSKLFSLLTCPQTTTFTMLNIFSPLEISSINIWEKMRSWHEKCSLLVAVRVSKTRVLKLPTIRFHPRAHWLIRIVNKSTSRESYTVLSEGLFMKVLLNWLQFSVVSFRNVLKLALLLDSAKVLT